MQKLFSFTKMHALGNDFMVMNGIENTIDPSHLPLTLLAHRHLGIGFDQFLLIESSNSAQFRCRIFNADGSEAEQCGNGLRCVAKYIFDEGLTQNKHFTIETKAGVAHAVILDHEMVSVTLGKPVLGNPFSIELLNHPTFILSMGNPHAILAVSAIEEAPVASLGKQIALHERFPEGTNVGFMEIINRNHILLRTYERGVGETFSCGSNTCAAVAAGILNGQLDNEVQVDSIFGHITVAWPNTDEDIKLIGPAIKSFDGVWHWDDYHQ